MSNKFEGLLTAAPYMVAQKEVTTDETYKKPGLRTRTFDRRIMGSD
ncbi:MAG: hypothetical protein WC028_02565 [Candidatus Obscuribacterales bacterium]